MTKRKEKTGGGLDGISVKEAPKSKVATEEPDPKPEPELKHEPVADSETPAENGGLSSEELEVNKAIIETVCVAIGRIAIAITGTEDVAFDEAETEQLKNLWSPLVPEVSPTAAAIIGTIVIVGGKVGIYMAKRHESKKRTKPAKSSKPPKTKQPAEVKEEIE